MARNRLILFIVVVLLTAAAPLGTDKLALADAAAQVGVWPDPPTRIEPADGATLTDPRPTFRIYPVQSGDWYQLQVDDSFGFSSPVLDRVTDTAYTPISDLAPGTYYWRVRARNVSGQWGLWSGAWRFTVVSAQPGGGTIVFGQNVTGALTPSSPRQIWRFSGQAGQVIDVRMVDTDGMLDSYLELYGTDGRLLTDDDDSGGDRDAYIHAYRLSATGLYALVARGYGTSTGSYALTLKLASPGRTISYGQTVTDTLTSADLQHEWTFSGTVGEAVIIAMNAADAQLDPLLELRDAGGSLLVTNDDGGPGKNALISNYRLPATGAYTIVAKGWRNSVGGYSLALSRSQPVTGTISYGEQVTGTLSASGQTDRWVFSGSAGDVVTIAMNDTDGVLDSFLELYGPSGAELARNDDGGGDYDALISDAALPADGQYTIVARAYGDSTGSYQLTLLATSGTRAYVPAGWFTMGRDGGRPQDGPAHQVYLDAFYIDRYEVTNSQYAECVRAGECAAPFLPGSNLRGEYYANPRYADYPAILVTWYNADRYCRWRGDRLPTEAEWEKAARWNPTTSASRIYPWGDDPPSATLLNYARSINDTTEVGRYPQGRSAVGAYDMAGNVWEWVNDWYDPNYYSYSPARNPTGPASGAEKGYRGGSYREGPTLVRTTYRGHANPTLDWIALGFRCASSQ